MSFSDVAPERWSQKFIKKASDLELMAGYPDGTFKPGQPVTREELAVVLSMMSEKELLLSKADLDEILPAILTIVIPLDNGLSELGTGFFIGPDLVLTDYHVVRDAKNPTISTSSDYLKDVELTLVAFSDPNADLDYPDIALLRSSVQSPAWLSLAVNDPGEAERVAVIGSPSGYPYAYTQGVVSIPQAADNPIGNPILFMTDASINPGDSGGPCFVGSKQVVGIAESKFSSESIEGMTFCTRISQVRQFLQRHGVEV